MIQKGFICVEGRTADMWKNGWRPLLLTAVLVLLGGCSFNSPEDLYTVPKAAEDYTNLQMEIDKVRNANAEYAGPLTGSYTQPVQLMDLDGDGVQEAVAFFRTTAVDNSPPLKIYIYHQTEEGQYAVQTIIEGEGTAINSISYVDLDGHTGPNGETDRELVVSWRLSDQMYRLMAYSVSGGEANVVLPAVSYTEYTLMDMDKDNQQEIVVLNLNTVEGICQADYYDYREGQMVLRSSAPMSDAITGLVSNTKPQPGYLRNGEIAEPALFVTSSLTTGVITDIFAWRESDLVNITLNSNTGMSDGTFRLSNSISIQDINADGYLEVPRPIAFPELRPTGSAENFYSVQWMQYDLSGAASVAMITYYNGEDGWYLTLPDSWQGKIALARQDNSGSGERGVLFYPYPAVENQEPQPFLAIYKLTGPNQTARAHAGNRFVLLSQDDAIYAAEFIDGSGWECGLTEESLTELFHLIQPDLTSAS